MKLINSLAVAAVAALLASPTLEAQEATKTAPAADSKKSDSETKPFKNIGVEEFSKLANDKKNVVLDVRTAKEFQDGHIPGAVNIDVNAPDFEKKVAALDKSKVYLVHCAAGRRSAKACDKLAELKFPHLYNLEPGFNGWTKAGKSVER